MRNYNKDRVSASSDSDSDDYVPASQINGSHVDNSKNSQSTKHEPASDSGNDSDSENNSSVSRRSHVDKNSGNERSEEEQVEHLAETDNVESSQKNTDHEKSASVKSIFNFEDLTSDDEIYTLQCPSMYNKQELCGRTLGSIKPKQGVSNDTKGFQFEYSNFEKKFITLAVPKKSGNDTLLKLPLRGHIIIEKVVDVPVNDFQPEDNYNSRKVVFPQDIKTRHPLLGVDWEAHIKIANEAVKKAKAKKNKSKKDVVVEIPEEQTKLKRESSEVETPVKKKKKRKHE